MTHEEIAAVTSTDASARVVTEFLESRGAKILRSTQHGEYLTASWTIGGWENLLATEFHEFEGPDSALFRASEYTVPEEIEAHIHGLMNVLEVSIIRNLSVNNCSAYSIVSAYPPSKA